MGFVFQTYNLLPVLTAVENVELPLLVTGVILGVVLSANMVSGLNTLQAGFTFAPPWGEIILIAVVAYGFSLLTTIAPAYQASRIYPAEALRVRCQNV